MRKFVVVAIFAAACAILLAAFGIGWADWGELASRVGIVQALMGALGVMVALLVVMGVLCRGKERWTALALGAILILGFSALTFFSVGWLIAPVPLALLVFSLWGLLRRRTERLG